MIERLRTHACTRTRMHMWTRTLRQTSRCQSLASILLDMFVITIFCKTIALELITSMMMGSITCDVVLNYLYNDSRGINYIHDDGFNNLGQKYDD